MTELTFVEPYGRLIDYALVNAGDPSLYGAIPALETLAALKPGQGVKIGLESDHDGIGPNPEHFWVEIVESRGVQGFIGKVQNDIQPGFHVKHGDHLIFCTHHIREIEG